MTVKEENFCKRCILHDGFMGVQLNSEGLCDFCSDPKHEDVNWSKVQISNEKRRNAVNDWNIVVKKMKNEQEQGKFDCILGYSGGKDSTALLDYLVNDLGLKLLAVTADTGFMTDIAKENIKTTLAKINVHHLMIEECIPTFKKLYKWQFLNHFSDDVFLARNICDYCSDLIHSIIVKEAIKEEIPYVLFGYSPDQVSRYFYEMQKEEAVSTWKPNLLKRENFDENDEKWYLSDEEINNGKIPRILLPYHVINYQEEEIINLVENKSLIKKGHADPLLTNCNVVHAATFYDLNRYGGILYAYQYAELVRQDPEQRKKWLRTLKMSTPLILENRFKTKQVNNFFEKIGVTQEELLNIVQKHLEKDPNRKLIEKNKGLFKKRKSSDKNNSH